jgi:hypothetical protein
MDGMEFQTKLEQKHLQGALKGLARGIEEKDGWVWVKNFLRHQKNDLLNPDNPAHRQIIGLVKDQVERFPSVKLLLPKGASKGLQSPIGKGKGKGSGKERGKEEAKNSPIQIRIGKLLGRRESTQWSKEELQALKEISEPSAEEWFQIEEFYSATNIGPDQDYRRTAILTLLRHWTGELDKARSYCFLNGIKFTPPAP